MGKAINNTLSAWDGLCVFLEDGRIENDNNTVENAIRPTAVGKKSWLFIGDAQAGGRSAIVFTVIEACRRRGINPLDYLLDVFVRMPLMTSTDYPSVTPEAWRKAQQPAKPASKAHATCETRPVLEKTVINSSSGGTGFGSEQVEQRGIEVPG